MSRSLLSRCSALLTAALLAVPVFTSGDDVTVPFSVSGTTTVTVDAKADAKISPADVSKKPESIDTSAEPVGDTTGADPSAPVIADKILVPGVLPQPQSPVASEDLVTIVGPTEATVGAYFIVSVKVPPAAENVLSAVETRAPDGAMPAIELAGKTPGELVYLFQQVQRGEYVFRASAQISVDRSEGFDPHDEDSLLVVVGGTPPIPPQPPGPQPPGPQPPGPTPAPFPADGLSILITYESTAAGKLTAGQRAVIFGSEIRDFLNSVCKTEADGVTRAFRIWDDDSDVSLAPEKWQKAMAVPRQSETWLVISTKNKGGYSGPLPAGPEEFKALVQPFVE